MTENISPPSLARSILSSFVGADKSRVVLASLAQVFFGRRKSVKIWDLLFHWPNHNPLPESNFTFIFIFDKKKVKCLFDNWPQSERVIASFTQFLSIPDLSHFPAPSSRSAWEVEAEEVEGEWHLPREVPKRRQSEFVQQEMDPPTFWLLYTGYLYKTIGFSICPVHCRVILKRFKWNVPKHLASWAAKTASHRATFNILCRSLVPWNPFVRENSLEEEKKRTGAHGRVQMPKKTWNPKKAGCFFPHFAKKQFGLMAPPLRELILPVSMSICTYIRRPHESSKKRATHFLVKNFCQKFAGSQFPRRWQAAAAPAAVLLKSLACLIF